MRLDGDRDPLGQVERRYLGPRLLGNGEPIGTRFPILNDSSVAQVSAAIAYNRSGRSTWWSGTTID
ncbi:MAG TPA: hypothetical protein ENL34_08765 [Chloroflexi bacterium]|nr:hypothetical protein [Chloroflexota bacterium]